ncbi:veA protein [Coccidioides immitis H538.4]|uniref:VeA protein n=1 Tax=Coccidioides immitis H538.4 TaxID=396776 RepID=A0A0J8RM68_COCIT|nr:veA protein [Coccidioides immitis H538.4]
MSSKESILNPENETESSFVRTTREGKKLTYTLKVIQQPERARACGAGAKASADRRPVDPPPVVELRVYESDQNDMNKTDITFAYNANFFLFTTLEWARPIAHPRGQSQSAATPPVLTGVPVAGVAYLDRPVQAGYFIFPDLCGEQRGCVPGDFSEGGKAASFLNDESKAGGSPDLAIFRKPTGYKLVPAVMSRPRRSTFYSGKKFPGPAESTMLSRTGAEQGCRVRIRRDVRMRRREHKGNKDFNGGYDERHMTPDNYPGTPIERPRSASNASVDNPYAYCPTSTPRRVPSAQGFSYPPAPYQQPVAIPPPPPPGPSPAPMAQSHLTFGAPQVQYSAPPASIPPVVTQPPPALYSPRPAYAHNRQASSGSGLDAQAQKYPPTLPLKPDSTRPYLPPLLPTITSAYSSRVQDSPVSEPKGYSQLSQMPPPSPLHKASSSKPQYNLVPPTIIAADTTPAPPSNPPRTFDSARKMWAFDKQVLSGKRSHGETFGSAHLDRRLNDGARPDPLTEADSSDADAFSGHKVTYPRADGRLVERMAGMNA